MSYVSFVHKEFRTLAGRIEIRVFLHGSCTLSMLDDMTVKLLKRPSGMDDEELIVH